MKFLHSLPALLTPVLLAVGLAGCGGPAPERNLELTYISGHLGNYWSCPDQAGNRAALPPGLVAGDCAEGESCGPVDSCEHAALTVRVQNISNLLLRGLQVQELNLIGPEGPQPLEILSVEALEGTLAGDLASGEERRVRIFFKGPPSDSVERDGLPVEVRIEANPQSGATLQTPALQVIAAIAT